MVFYREYLCNFQLPRLKCDVLETGSMIVTSLSAGDLIVTGDITAANLKATGKVSGSNAEFIGNLAAGSATLQGPLNAPVGVLSNLIAINGAITGDLLANSETVTNNLNVNGRILGSDADFSGDLTARNLSLSGNLAATGTGTFTGSLSTRGGIYANKADGTQGLFLTSNSTGSILRDYTGNGFQFYNPQGARFAYLTTSGELGLARITASGPMTAQTLALSGNLTTKGALLLLDSAGTTKDQISESGGHMVLRNYGTGFEWQNSSGTKIAELTSDGNATVAGTLTIGDALIDDAFALSSLRINKSVYIVGDLFVTGDPHIPWLSDLGDRVKDLETHDDKQDAKLDTAHTEIIALGTWAGEIQTVATGAAGLAATANGTAGTALAQVGALETQVYTIIEPQITVLETKMTGVDTTLTNMNVSITKLETDLHTTRVQTQVNTDNILTLQLTSTNLSYDDSQNLTTLLNAFKVRGATTIQGPLVQSGAPAQIESLFLDDIAILRKPRAGERLYVNGNTLLEGDMTCTGNASLTGGLLQTTAAVSPQAGHVNLCGNVLQVEEPSTSNPNGRITMGGPLTMSSISTGTITCTGTTTTANLSVTGTLTNPALETRLQALEAGGTDESRITALETKTTAISYAAATTSISGALSCNNTITASNLTVSGTISNPDLTSLTTKTQQLEYKGPQSTQINGALTTTGNLTVGGNITAASGSVTAATLGGTMQTASQPNITSTGPLTSLTVTGNTTLQGRIIAPAGTLALTNTDIGYTAESTNPGSNITNSGACANGGYINVSLPPGTWLLIGRSRLTSKAGLGTMAVQSVEIGLSTSATSLNLTYVTQSTDAFNLIYADAKTYPCLEVTAVVRITTTTTYYVHPIIYYTALPTGGAPQWAPTTISYTRLG